MSHSQAESGCTMLEVLVSLALISVIALGSMYTLKLSSRRAMETQPQTRFFLSYTNIKSRLHDMLIEIKRVGVNPTRSVYLCMAGDTPSLLESERPFVTTLCEEDQFLNARLSVEVVSVERSSLGQCVYKATLMLDEVSVNKWSDLFQC